MSSRPSAAPARHMPAARTETVYADHLLEPWIRPLLAQLPSVRVFDCHTHVGENDPSGFSATLEELTEGLELVDGRAAVFPLKEPDGYREANLRVVEHARDSGGGPVALRRLDPADHPLERANEALAAGAVGLKLHPDGEEFALDDERLAGVFELADAERLPVIVHAGPELDGIGRTALDCLEGHPGMRMILAHGALTDLSWIHQEVDSHPNLFFDTSWWGPSHLMALLALVPPGRILSGGDLPYCTPLSGALTTLRCGLQAGLGEEQLAAMLGGQFERLVSGEEPLDLGPPPAHSPAPGGPLLQRVVVAPPTR